MLRVCQLPPGFVLQVCCELDGKVSICYNCVKRTTGSLGYNAGLLLCGLRQTATLIVQGLYCFLLDSWLCSRELKSPNNLPFCGGLLSVQSFLLRAEVRTSQAPWHQSVLVSVRRIFFFSSQLISVPSNLSFLLPIVLLCGVGICCI